MPLYQDPAGWSIWSASPGTRFVDWYTDGLFKLRSDNIPFKLEAFELMIDEPEKFLVFALKVDKDISTAWSKNSHVLVKCVCDGDTLDYRSIEFLVQQTTNRNDEQWYIGDVVRSNELDGFLFIDSKRPIYKTKNGNPLLIVNFGMRRIPDSVLNCEVKNVLVIKKGGE